MRGCVDDLEEATIVLIAAVAIHRNVDAAALHDVHAGHAVRSDDLFVGCEEALFESAGNFGLQVLGPVAKEKDAALDNCK